MENEFEGLAQRLLAAHISLGDACELLERSMIEVALAQHRGNQSAASKKLKIHRNTLQRKIQDYEMETNGNLRPRRKTQGARNGSGPVLRKPLAGEARSRKRRKGAA
jgi:hypothetical protein